jgi:DNA-binding transcriptional regulator PaaX
MTLQNEIESKPSFVFVGASVAFPWLFSRGIRILTRLRDRLLEQTVDSVLLVSLEILDTHRAIITQCWHAAQGMRTAFRRLLSEFQTILASKRFDEIE